MRLRRTAALAIAIGALMPATAHAAAPLGLTCTAQDGLQLCQGKVKTFDGVPTG